MPTRSETELVALANASFVAGFRKLTEHCPEGATREQDGLFAFVTGLPMSLFNGCIVTGPVAAEEIDDALEWLRAGGQPRRCWIIDELADELEAALLRHGLERQSDPYPGMVLVAVGTLPDARRRGVGTAISWAATEAGRRRGYDTVVLQASPMGYPIYAAMGFRTIVTYAQFAAPRAT